MKNKKKYAIEQLSKCKYPMYLIDGNHDRWFIKNSGAYIVQDICENLENCMFLGNDEGDLVVNNVIIKLWHGEDGNSYSLSYRIQKIIEAFVGGQKPQILLCGHVHKALYLPCERNIHAFGTGALSRQSKWMRSKRLANHAGFWIIEFTYNEKGVSDCSEKFYNFYE